MTNPNPSGGARAFVLAGPTLAFLATVFRLVNGSSLPLGGVWFGAALWAFLAALSCVLWRGFRHRDWFSLERYEFPEGNGERFDWSTRTGRYAWRRDLEDQDLGDNGPNTPFP